MPPMTNIEMKPSANIMDVVKRSLPPQIVASQLKILTPVGTAMIIEVIMKGTRRNGSMPLVNMWCAHTRKPKMPMARLENAISL